MPSKQKIPVCEDHCALLIIVYTENNLYASYRTRKFCMKVFLSFFLFALLSAYSMVSKAKNIPAIQQGIRYQEVNDISQYWVSEKLDGVRGYWNGKQLLTRKGNIINAPAWFTQNWPKQAIDGELWIARQQFEQVSAIVRQHKAADTKWKKVRFMIFDLPTHKGDFSTRIQNMQLLVQQVNSPYFHNIAQKKFISTQALFTHLDHIVDQGGEGLMLHHQNAFYKTGRTKQLMKLKKYQDAEAIVIAHHQGKGKYKDKLGAITVVTPAGLQFKIGSGFTDKQRANPPPIGSQITYKYFGKTQKGTPKFASFMRIRTAL